MLSDSFVSLLEQIDLEKQHQTPCLSGPVSNNDKPVYHMTLQAALFLVTGDRAVFSFRLWWSTIEPYFVCHLDNLVIITNQSLFRRHRNSEKWQIKIVHNDDDDDGGRLSSSSLS